MPQHMPFMKPHGSTQSSPVTTNATTTINIGSGAIFQGVIVNTAGTAWQAEVYSGNPSSGGVLLATIPCNTVGPIASPSCACPGGLYVVTSGTTPGNLTVCYN